MGDHDRDLDALLPLKRAWLHILLALADGPSHGYAIRNHVEERTDGRVKLWPATLYGSIRQLEEEGLIRETEGEADPEEDDDRRRYYDLTPRGHDVLEAEVDQLQELVDTARASRAFRNA
ncbi:MAG TPA: PadR family transcriptional regulator [Longimicrobiales bacterium]|nr:PadR family transcriptional regulator [Longimicrobiales bacterium]